MLLPAGLISLYIADCETLAEIAAILQKSSEEKKLRERAALATLWDEPSGIFLNKYLRSGRLSRRISPTNFYPLLARTATPEQALRMVNKHLLNTAEFWGEWVITATPRNDSAFSEQTIGVVASGVP